MDIYIISMNTCFEPTSALIKNICVHIAILGVACCFLNALTAMFIAWDMLHVWNLTTKSELPIF